MSHYTYDTEIAAFILNKYEQYCQMDITYLYGTKLIIVEVFLLKRNMCMLKV